jgi:hypothetical protein
MSPGSGFRLLMPDAGPRSFAGVNFGSGLLAAVDDGQV